MARLSYSNQALMDLERISDFLLPVDIYKRELIISQGKTGYVALYSYEEEFDTALILAIRHQREAGFHVQ